MEFTSKGSLWRVWDFHIHSPASFEWQGTKLRGLLPEQINAEMALMVQAMEDAPAQVFVIQDYWTFDGYITLRNYLNKNQDINFSKTVLPGIELRLQSPTTYRLNVHGVLSEELTDQQLNDFKSALKLAGTNRPLSDEAIADYAKNHTDQPTRIRHGAQNLDLSVLGNAFGFGAKIVEITRDSFNLAFNSLPNDSGVVMMPWDTSNGLSDIDLLNHFASARELFKLPHIFETRNEAYRKAFIGEECEDNAVYFEPFFNALNQTPRLPVAGSDAHSFSRYGDFPSSRITWLKAEPCFRGLMQAFKEPAGRSFIGDKPAKLKWAESHPTELIKNIAIKKLDHATTTDVWFDGTSIDLSSDLIAIIGNKGSGKSALADVIALTGGAGINEDYFSFLTKKRFRDPKMAWAQDFSATITWSIDPPVAATLSGDSVQSSVNRVKYISQRYFEELCGSGDSESTSSFEKELKSVIFSHVDIADKQDYGSLDSLLFDRERGFRSSINSARANLSNINSQIIEAEEKHRPERLDRINELIAHKESELKAHEEIKLPAIPEPSNDQTDEQKAEIQNLEQARESLKVKEKEKEEILAEKSKLVSLRNSYEAIAQSTNELESTVQTIESSVESHLEKTGLKWADIVSLKVNQQKINEELQGVNGKIAQSSQAESDLEKNMANLKKTISTLERSLDSENQKYQLYLSNLKAWEDQKKHIIGTADQSDSLSFYKAQLEAYGKIPEKLTALIVSRSEQVALIFDYIQNIQNLRKSMYSPVQELIDSHQLVKDEFQLEFDTSMSVTDLRTIFFNYIKRDTATFAGLKEGFEMLDQLINISNFESLAGVAQFLKTLLDMLQYDTSDTNREHKIDIENKLLKGDTKLLKLYDYLFGLEFLDSKYSLLLQGIPVDKLSPGQRGALLLIFYLLVDKETKPIVLDQPEENLDNQTVYSLLVPVIKEAKDRRQVIMVTHNANLAVTCDAEQIIHAEFDRTDMNRMTYESGAIENPKINGLVLDILEGTEPAFANRRDKYMPQVN